MTTRITASLEGESVVIDSSRETAWLDIYDFGLNKFVPYCYYDWPLSWQEADEMTSGWNVYDKRAAMALLMGRVQIEVEA